MVRRAFLFLAAFKMFGMSSVSFFLSGPSVPLVCAPQALKYLKETYRRPCDTAVSWSIFSNISFDWPYGLVGTVSSVSFTGMCLGSPYVAAGEEKIRYFTLYRSIIFNKWMEAKTLFSYYSV